MYNQQTESLVFINNCLSKNTVRVARERERERERESEK